MLSFYKKKQEIKQEAKEEVTSESFYGFIKTKIFSPQIVKETLKLFKLNRDSEDIGNFKQKNDLKSEEHSNEGDADISEPCQSSSSPQISKELSDFDVEIIENPAFCPQKEVEVIHIDDSSTSDEESTSENDIVVTKKIKCSVPNCQFLGRNFVNHYLKKHPKKDIPSSKFTAQEANAAIRESRIMDFENVDPQINDEFSFTCRFCGFEGDGNRKECIKQSYEHCTEHTGEYRYKCKFCSHKCLLEAAISSHFYKFHRNTRESNFHESVDIHRIPEENLVYGYLCSSCYYVQLNKSNVVQHVKRHHKRNLNVEIVKINMSRDNCKNSDWTARNIQTQNTREAENSGNLIIKTEKNSLETFRSTSHACNLKRAAADTSFNVRFFHDTNGKIEDGNENAEDRKTPSSRVDENAMTLQNSRKRKIDYKTTNESRKIRCIEGGKFGPYGNPENGMYVCPLKNGTLCKGGSKYKTKEKHSILDHLSRELGYYRWHCQKCDFKSVDKCTMSRHCTSLKHETEDVEYKEVKNEEFDKWLSAFMKFQTEIIKKSGFKLSRNGITKDLGARVNRKSTASVSQYSRKSDPIDLANINMWVSVGGRNVRLKCETFSKLKNINPQVKIEKIKLELNNIR